MSKNGREQKRLQQRAQITKLPGPREKEPGKLPATPLQLAITNLLVARQEIATQKRTIASLEIQLADAKNQLLGAQIREQAAADMDLRKQHGLPPGEYSINDDDKDPQKKWIVVKSGALPAPAAPVPESPQAEEPDNNEPTIPEDVLDRLAQQPLGPLSDDDDKEEPCT